MRHAKSFVLQWKSILYVKVSPFRPYSLVPERLETKIPNSSIKMTGHLLCLMFFVFFKYTLSFTSLHINSNHYNQS